MGLLHQGASLYVLPSLYEGSEQALLLPLAYSLPLVSSTLPNITSILQKDDAIFFRPMSIPDMYEALKKALASTPSNQKKKSDMSAYETAKICTQIRELFSQFEDKKEGANSVSTGEKTNL